MGVLQSGVVLAAKVLGGGSFAAAEREAYHAALVSLVGEDAGREVRAWCKHAVRREVVPGATLPRNPVR